MAPAMKYAPGGHDAGEHAVAFAGAHVPGAHLAQPPLEDGTDPALHATGGKQVAPVDAPTVDDCVPEGQRT